MELTHRFTVPVGVPEAWEAFADVESVAECFPGATVTSVAGDEFEGTCKVKLGPIALVYAGQGSFLERDEAGRRLVLEAKGKDKRGNGTAGATVTATFAEEGEATRVDVSTELHITGKAAQFGRGNVLQDVSDKLLQEFVTCLEARVTGPAAPAVPADGGGVAPEPEEEAAEPAAADGVGVGAAHPRVAGEPTAHAAPAVPSAPAPPQADDAIDLGATVLPILLRSYWRQFAAGVLVLVVVRWLWGRRH